MKLNQNAAHKLRTLAINVEHRANEYDSFSREEGWQIRAGQLDRAAGLLKEAAQILDGALADRAFAPAPKRPTPDMKLTPDQWCDAYGVTVYDPDGWRGRNDPPWEEPITLMEFKIRSNSSTTDAAKPGWEGVRRDAQLCREDLAAREATS